MNKQQLADILKYSHPKELYIVDWENKLVVLTCPFKVIAKGNVGRINKSEIVEVDEIKVTMRLTTVYVIEGQAYFYYHFDIWPL
tara:strand:+ start:24618 stop:24869 length:252 start_codon:yes stop_codon:yes gene_type:complete